jgi:hypothetical protein
MKDDVVAIILALALGVAILLVLENQLAGAPWRN